MKSLELRQQIRDYLKTSNIELNDRAFLVTYMANNLSNDDLEMDVSEPLYKSTLLAFSSVFKIMQMVDKNSLTQRRMNEALNLLSQIDSADENTLDDIAFKLLQLCSRCDINLDGSASIVYKKTINRGKA